MRNTIQKGLLACLVGLLCVGVLEAAGRWMYFSDSALHAVARGRPSRALPGMRYLAEKVSAGIHARLLPLRCRWATAADVKRLTGGVLGRIAWEASLAERGVTPRFPEPREGFSFSRLHPKKKDKFLRWMEPEIDVPGRITVDRHGFQHAQSQGHAPDHHILILGGSVAGGAYASEADKTYFSQMVRLLEARHVFVQIDVLAAGGWRSTDELMAFILKGLDRKPDVVIVLDGLNDLTLSADAQEADTAEREYLRNVVLMAKIASGYDMDIVFALQPLLPCKRVKSLLESRIIELTAGASRLPERYETIRSGLMALRDGNRVHFVDCSHVLDEERLTTFADFWHFSDPGHQLLAEYLCSQVDPLLTKRQYSGHTTPTP